VDDVAVRLEHVDFLNLSDGLDVHLLEGSLELLVIGARGPVDLLLDTSGSSLAAVHTEPLASVLHRIACSLFSSADPAFEPRQAQFLTLQSPRAASCDQPLKVGMPQFSFPALYSFVGSAAGYGFGVFLTYPADVVSTAIPSISQVCVRAAPQDSTHQCERHSACGRASRYPFCRWGY